MSEVKTVKGVTITMDDGRLQRMIAEAYSGGKIMAAVQKAAFDVERTAKVLCPVDTGALANSIKTEQAAKDGSIIYADIGPHTDYALYVEKGHAIRTEKGYSYYVPGRHYMENALNEEAPKLERALNIWARTLGT